MREIPEELIDEYLEKLQENDGFPEGFYLETTEYTMKEVESYLLKLGLIKCIQPGKQIDERIQAKECFKYEITDKNFRS